MDVTNALSSGKHISAEWGIGQPRLRMIGRELNPCPAVREHQKSNDDLQWPCVSVRELGFGKLNHRSAVPSIVIA